MVLLMAAFLLPSAQASLARLEHAVRKKPKDLRLRFLLGKKYSSSGKYKKAIRQYQKILQKRQLPTVLFQLGLAHARLGDLTAAVLNWTPILEQKPGNTKTMGYLGLALYKQGLQSPNEDLRERLFEESLDWWKRILKLDPSNLRARYFAGIEYFKLGRHEDAARQWLIFLRVKKNHPKVLTLLTKALLKMRKYEKAKRTLAHLRSLPVSSRPKLRRFLKKASAAVARGARGARPEDGKLEPEDLDRGAITRDPHRPQPPGPEPPPPPPLDGYGVKPPSQIPVDEPVTLQAETLFLDGLEYKEKGNYEKALFSFLQAVDIQPDFSQVYLQVGEVYLGLAKLAPTPKEFKERLRLAEDSLVRVKSLSPGTLLAHAGQSKLVVVKRSQSLGFNGYHENVARKAISQERYTDAFDELVLLLSVKDFRSRVFFKLAGIIPHLTEGNRQDLRFFLEELKNQHPGHALTSYLLGRVYLTMDGDPAAFQMGPPELRKAWEGFAKDSPLRETYLTFSSTPSASPVDTYVVAKMFAKLRNHEAALEAVTLFLEESPRDHPFYQDAAKLKEQLTVALRPVQGGASQKNHFKEELELLRRTVKETNLFFEVNQDGIPQLSPGHLEDEARFRALRIFVDGTPDHGLGRFLLGWLLKHRDQSSPSEVSSGGGRAAGQAMIDEVHLKYLEDPRYHHQMAIQCLLWSLVDSDLEIEATRFFRTTRQILLSLGRTQDKQTAETTLGAARFWLQLGKTERAQQLTQEAQRFDPEILQAHALQFEFFWATGGFFQALGELVSWFLDALSRFWVRQVLLSDLAILLFLSLLLVSLAWSAVTLVRYHPELHYMLQKFWATKGLILPLSLFMTVALLVLFPTGLILFVPFLSWPVLRKAERRIFLALLFGILIVPLFLPLSLETNYPLLQAFEQVSSGEFRPAIKGLEQDLQEHASDSVRLYLLSISALRLGDLEKADQALQKLAKMDTSSDGVLVNRGVLAARRGDYEGAEKFFTQALSMNPSNARVLFDFSSLHNIQGHKEKTEQYRRWALQVGAESLPIEELLDIPPEVTRLPLLDQPLAPQDLAPYFDFYSTTNFLRFNAPLLAFLGWLVAGGGLVGLLLFARERMDIDMSAVHKEEGEVLLPELKEKSWKQAILLNGLFPGLGLTYVGRPAQGTLLCLMTVFAYLTWFSGGGFLLTKVFPLVESNPVSIILGLILVAALTLHLLAQYMLWSRRQDLQAR
jgi:tetratricopeptide (TPR) repeat protein